MSLNGQASYVNLSHVSRIQKSQIQLSPVDMMRLRAPYQREREQQFRTHRKYCKSNMHAI